MTREEKVNLIRCVEERIAAEYAKQEMKTPVHLCLGQEEICVDICELLKPDDLLFAYYRSHGWYLAKGGNLNALIAELYGKSMGCSGGYGGSMHLIDTSVGFHGTTAIVGSQLAHAVGASLAIRLKHELRYVVCVFGDGATEEGVFSEALLFASLHRLNMVFVCINDGMASKTPIELRQPSPRGKYSTPRPSHFIEMRAEAIGMTTIQWNFAGKLELRSAMERGGPIFVHVLNHRKCPHVGPEGVGMQTEPLPGNAELIEQAFRLAKQAHFPEALCVI